MNTMIKGWGNKKVLVYVLVVIILIAVLVPQFDQLLEGLKILAHAEWYWLGLAVCFLVLSYLVSAFIYCLLAKKRIGLFTTFLAQIAGTFANRIVPAGLGSLGLNADYLIKHKHSPVQAGTVVGVNSFLAFINHMLLLGIALLMGGISLNDVITSNKIPTWLIAVVISLALVILFTIIANSKLKIKIKSTYKNVIENLAAYKDAPCKIIFAFIGAGAITSCFVMALYCCAMAVGLDITIAQTFIVYTVGVIVGAAVLTPGGLGGVEAGMYAAFVTYGGKPSLVFATVIIYRLISYWLPILPGALIFVFLRKRKQI